MAKRPGTSVKDYVVFISHATGDKWIARQIANLIESKLGTHFGVSVFLDEKSIDGGENIPIKIRKALQDCGEFIVLLSSNSLNGVLSKVVDG